jgi:putative DNA primase/helicase
MKRSEFTITCKRDGVFLTVGDKCIRVADPIRVRSIGTRLADKVTLFEIKFETIDGDTRSETFPFSYLHRERWDKIKVRVGDQGYVWPEDRHVSDEILRQLAAERPKRRFVQVSAPGWYHPAFVLPGKVFGPHGSGTEYRIDPDSDAHIGAFVCGKGTLEGWQETVAKPARKSSCLRVAIAAAFAAPLLRPMAMDSFAINWFSDTSDGKTTMLFAAASVAGLIGVHGLPGWADSEPGMEDQARGHRDCVLPLDESADGNGKIPLKDKAKTLAIMIARNRPRRLSKKHERAHALQNREYRIIAQSSSELALSQVAIDAGGRRLGGEEVRFTDVCASEPGSLGIFDGQITKLPRKTARETTKKLIDQIKNDAEANQGFAFQEFLRNYFDDAEALSKIRAYKDRFESEVGVTSSNAALRIRSNFALIWAAAAMAIDYGVLPWKKPPTFRAVEKCLRKALEVIEAGKAPASPADAATSILVALNDRLEKADLRKVVPRKQITPQQASRRVKADGFRINGDIYLKPDRLRKWIPSHRDRVVLKENGVFLTRRGDAATIEQVIAGIPGKPRYYVLDSRKLGQLLRKEPSDT